MKPTLLILAAGMGSRYGGLKQLDHLGTSGETIMDYSVFDAARAGFGKVVFVIRRSFETEFRDMFIKKLEGKVQVELVFQDMDNIPAGFEAPADRVKPWGTGHAILMAKDVINEPFAVINADDFYGANAFKVMADFLTSGVSESVYAMNGYQLSKTLSEFGTVARGICSADADGFLTDIKERTSIERKANGKIVFTENGTETELDENVPVSMNFWGFAPNLFKHLEEKFTAFLKVNASNPKSEFYIPFVVDDLMKEGKVKTKVLPANSTWFGVTYKEDKPSTMAKIAELVKQGVYPEKLW